MTSRLFRAESWNTGEVCLCVCVFMVGGGGEWQLVNERSNEQTN